MKHLALLLFLTCSLWAGRAAAAPSELIFEQEDPPGDADGPGSYGPPTDADISPQDFDLRRFVVRVDGNDAVFEVTLGEAVKKPSSTWRTNSTPIELTNGIYLQNIDIYIDTDPRPGIGLSVSIPGRRVNFVNGQTWEAAVVFAPQPSLSRAVVETAFGSDAKRVVFAEPVTSRGRTVIARVPWARLGGRPSRSWGWSVQVSGASWERNFFVADQLKGTSQLDALTMPVSTTAERWMFGGAPLGRWHPQVVDVLLPPSVDQHKVLSGFDNDNSILAQVPFIYSTPPPLPPPVVVTPPVASTPSASLVHTVVDVADDVVSIDGPTEGLKPLMFGTIQNADGGVVRVVVQHVLPAGILANPVDRASVIQRGARVEFAPAKN
jgi:carbohydrate-binding DOMON domain-containing protein